MSASKPQDELTCHTTMLEMTGERKERLDALRLAIAEAIHANTESPIEAYYVLHSLLDTFKRAFGIVEAEVTEFPGSSGKLS